MPQPRDQSFCGQWLPYSPARARAPGWVSIVLHVCPMNETATTLTQYVKLLPLLLLARTKTLTFQRVDIDNQRDFAVLRKALRRSAIFRCHSLHQAHESIAELRQGSRRLECARSTCCIDEGVEARYRALPRREKQQYGTCAVRTQSSNIW